MPIWKDTVSSSMSSNFFTAERIDKMQKYLINHPIDHRYDELCSQNIYDGDDIPPDQLAARGYYDVLKELGKLPPGVE